MSDCFRNTFSSTFQWTGAILTMYLDTDHDGEPFNRYPGRAFPASLNQMTAAILKDFLRRAHILQGKKKDPYGFIQGFPG
jgi:hypothetical protein